MSTSTLRPITSPTLNSRPVPIALAQERPYSHRPETPPRRHSTISVSPRPFRSSPLAGPALIIPVLTPSDPELTRAFPDPYLLCPPLPTLAKPGQRTSIVLRDSPGIYIPRRPKTAPSATPALIPASRPTSIPTSTSIPTPTLPSRVASTLTRRLSYVARARQDGTDGDKAEAPALAQPNKITAPLLATRQPTPSTSRNPSENWLSSTAFDTTPRFSRLSLSPDVVLPVPAHQYRRARTCSTLSASASGRRVSLVEKTVPEDAEIEAEAQPEAAVSIEAEPEPKEEAKNEIGAEAEEPPEPSLTRSSSSSGVSSAGVPTPMSVSFLEIPTSEEKKADDGRAVEVVEAGPEREHRIWRLGLGLRRAKSEAKLGQKSKSSTGSSFLGFSFSGKVVEASPSTISASKSRTNASGRSGSVRRLWKSLKGRNVGK